MGVRSRIGDTLVRVGKTFGGSVPEQFRQAEEASQMTPASPFSPGPPIGPYDGYDRTPRARDFVTGYNIATRPRTHERVSFDTLTGLIEAYDVAQICVWHRIDSIRSLEWKLIAQDGTSGDVSDAVDTGMAALRKPDHENSFETWLAKWLYDVLAYDAGTLYRMRNRGGRAVGLGVVDGRTIAPLLDYWGNSPKRTSPDDPEPEAYVQYVNGLPWNWLTRSDLIYEPFRPRANSPYGTAPLESIILNANTDLRFQVYFLQRFTEGNLPAAFASAPDTWSPEQIEQFQEYWDGFMYADQSRKHQIRWMPGGSKFAWSNEKDFSDVFSMFMMRKSCAAYHVVPSDLGFTEDVNRSSGESQADVQHRVGDLPLIRYVQRTITSFLQDDLGLPLKHAFDLGEEQADRVQQAQADKIYVDMGAISASAIGEMRYGTSDPQTIPRYVFTERAGPIPLASLFAVAGEIDQATGLPALGAALPHEVFGGTEGVLPNPPIKVMSLAEQEYGPSAMPPAPPPQPKMTDADVGLPGEPVAKEGEAGAPAAGITSETGVYSYDLAGEDDDEDENREQVAKSARDAEFDAFRRHRKARLRVGEWTDFEFRAMRPVRAHRLNDRGRLAVRKAAGEVGVAGLAVLAADTGRVLMLQRALDDGDPAGGTWEFPGGHVEGTETPDEAAAREWSEETGLVLPSGRWADSSWKSADGVYQGFVYVMDAESSLPIFDREDGTNPDDPDGDQVEALAWWDPADLAGNPAVRPELLASVDAVLAALGSAPGSIAKAVSKGPKGWPGWKLDLTTAAHWAPLVRESVTTALPPAKARGLGRDYLTAHPQQRGDDPGKRDRNKAAHTWLAAWMADHGVTLVPQDQARAIAADGVLIGGASAQAATEGREHADTGGWHPGDEDKAKRRAEELGLAALLAAILSGGRASAAGITAEAAAGGIASGYLWSLAIILAGTDADWAGSEDTLDELGGMLSDALADEDLAVTLVGSEISIWSGLAAQEYYLANTTSLLSWVTEDAEACQACKENQRVSPLPAGRPFPTGDLCPPAHPGCRCALLPAG
jgi:8-oxo-dGTP pyrophosphatase MutT (NUDIX family)